MDDVSSEHGNTAGLLIKRIFASRLAAAVAPWREVVRRISSVRLTASLLPELAVNVTGNLLNRSSGGPGTSCGTGEQIEINGVVYPSKRAATRAYNVSIATFLERLKNGWTPEQVVGITSPPPRARSKGRTIYCDGVKHDSLTQFAEKFDKSQQLVKQRIKRGWTPEQAVELVPPPAGSNVPKQISCDGLDFRSVAALIRYYKQPGTRIRSLLAAGHSPEMAVGLEPLPGDIIGDGQRFKSKRVLARHYGKTRELIRKRRLRGLSKEEAVR